MRGHGNVTGGDVIMRWTTGYPFGVSLSRGYPRFNPGEYTTADTLAKLHPAGELTPIWKARRFLAEPA